MQASGVDFHCLRSFLPRNVSFSLGDTPVNLVTVSSSNGNFSSPVSWTLLPSGMSIQGQNLTISGEMDQTESFTESDPNASQGIVNITDNFLTESESQCQMLFTFIERGIDWIHYQLDERSDCVIVPLDHYADITSYMNTGAERRP